MTRDDMIEKVAEVIADNMLSDEIAREWNDRDGWFCIGWFCIGGALTKDELERAIELAREV